MANLIPRFNTQERIDEIKRIWQPELTTTQLAALVDPAIFGRRPDRCVIIGMFQRHAARLAPCFLRTKHSTVRRPSKTKKDVDVKPKVQKEPKPAKVVKPKLKLNEGGTVHQRIARQKAESKRAIKAAESIPLVASERSARRFDLDQMMLNRDPFFVSLRSEVVGSMADRFKLGDIRDKESRHPQGRQEEQEEKETATDIEE